MADEKRISKVRGILSTRGRERERERKREKERERERK